MEKLFEPIHLRGDYCTLVPLSIKHHHDLIHYYLDEGYL